MNKQCNNEVNECLPCNDTPIENLSAEAPDEPTFLAIDIVKNDPPIGETFERLGCLGWAVSTVSQADANAQAEAQTELCKPWENPDPIRYSATGCFGTVYSYVSQAAANAIAAATYRDAACQWTWPEWPVVACEAGSDPLSPLVPKVVFGAQTLWMQSYNYGHESLRDEIDEPAAVYGENLTAPHVPDVADSYCVWRGTEYVAGPKPSYRVILLKRPNHPWEFYYRLTDDTRLVHRRSYCNAYAAGPPTSPCSDVVCDDIAGAVVEASFNLLVWCTGQTTCPDLQAWFTRYKATYPTLFLDFHENIPGDPDDWYINTGQAKVDLALADGLWQTAWGGGADCPNVLCQTTETLYYYQRANLVLNVYGTGGSSTTLTLPRWNWAVREGADSNAPAGTYRGNNGSRYDKCGAMKTRLIDGGDVTVTHEVPPP